LNVIDSADDFGKIDFDSPTVLHMVVLGFTSAELAMLYGRGEHIVSLAEGKRKISGPAGSPHTVFARDHDGDYAATVRRRNLRRRVMLRLEIGPDDHMLMVGPAFDMWVWHLSKSRRDRRSRLDK
jgi:hypothetical protein